MGGVCGIQGGNEKLFQNFGENTLKKT